MSESPVFMPISSDARCESLELSRFRLRIMSHKLEENDRYEKIKLKYMPFIKSPKPIKSPKKTRNALIYGGR